MRLSDAEIAETIDAATMEWGLKTRATGALDMYIARAVEAATVKMHAECHAAMQDEAREEGGHIEWTPGRERPEQEPPHVLQSTTKE